MAAVKMPAVFGEAQPDDDHHGEKPRRPVLFHAHAQGLLRVVATDLRSLAWHRSLALPDIHDLVCSQSARFWSQHFHPHSTWPDLILLLPFWTNESLPKQDDVGIAGSCSDFIDYLYSSLSSGHVKLLYSSSPSGILFHTWYKQLVRYPTHLNTWCMLCYAGPTGAQLMATKAKGLPRITISLDPVAPLRSAMS